MQSKFLLTLFCLIFLYGVNGAAPENPSDSPSNATSNSTGGTDNSTSPQASNETSPSIPQSTNPFTERTLVLLKPEVTHRGLIGTIIAQIEHKGFKIAAMKFLVATQEQIEAHYADHAGKPFFESLVARTTNQPIVAMVLEGLQAVAEFRRMMGLTDPKKSPLGTLRSQFGMQTERNLIHASDSIENAQLEIFLWFDPSEIYSYDRAVDSYIYFG
ncbi:nucleoside-diphosphate kinase [Cryptosporidium felis]|nr:nucleoside-diphosphate kinase [Cryptosporidium felis]